MSRDPDRPLRRRRQLTDDERALWSHVTRSIAPLRPLRPAAPAATEPAPASVSDDIVGAPSGHPLAPRPRERTAVPPPASLDRRLKQRLARGTEAIDARIDLHGLTQNEAHAALARFLRNARAEGARIVLVITGRGSPRRADPAMEIGVLRRQVPLWLKSPSLREHVIGFAPAHHGHGGEGALYVRVRRPREKRE